MDCEQVREMLDAYALGAVERIEAEGIEEHVAECVRCWEELTKSQRTAALIALSTPMREAPAPLRSRIIAAAKRERAAVEGERVRVPLFGRLRGWPAATGVMGVAAAASLAFAAFLQIQMNDLRNEKDELEEQVDFAREQLTEQGGILQVSAAEDARRVVMDATEPGSPAWAEYVWSSDAEKGFIACHDMPQLGEGEVYQAWFVTQDEPVSAGTFENAQDGSCAYLMKPEQPVGRPAGVGISKEKGEAEEPSGAWLLFADFER